MLLLISRLNRLDDDQFQRHASLLYPYLCDFIGQPDLKPALVRPLREFFVRCGVAFGVTHPDDSSRSAVTDEHTPSACNDTGDDVHDEKKNNDESCLSHHESKENNSQQNDHSVGDIKTITEKLVNTADDHSKSALSETPVNGDASVKVNGHHVVDERKTNSLEAEADVKAKAADNNL